MAARRSLVTEQAVVEERLGSVGVADVHKVRFGAVRGPALVNVLQRAVDNLGPNLVVLEPGLVLRRKKPKGCA